MNTESLVALLIKNKILRTPLIIEAFLDVDRKDFVPDHLQKEAYEDKPLPLSQGSTISQPSTVAFMIELLQPQVNDKILDVGSGSGYTTALLSEIVTETGLVFGVERSEDVLELGRKNLKKYGFPHAEIKKAGKVLGLEEEAPFTRILVSAEAHELPKELVSQLTLNGCMVIPVKNSVLKVKKIGPNALEIEEYPGFAFVPLK
ncbi:MAG: protein-L-isoaspartate O-methyltransferase [Acidobacteriaceae bacterium]